MKPPRTAERWALLKKLGWRHDSLPISTIMESHEALENELAAERALADRLANVLTLYNHDLLAGEMMQWVSDHDESLAAWKAARNEQKP